MSHASTARAGRLRGKALLDAMLAVPSGDRDGWVDQLLGFDGLPDDVASLPRESVPYLPSGVEEILAAVREAPVTADDHFVDLGSGVGRAVVLTHELTDARATGVEIQEPLVRLAQARAAALALSGVSFVHANAAECDLAALDGSVFFLYAPFGGDMLAAVLQRLERVAQRRPIVICAVGLELRGLQWVRPRPTSCLSLTLYDSVETSLATRGTAP